MRLNHVAGSTLPCNLGEIGSSGQVLPIESLNLRIPMNCMVHVTVLACPPHLPTADNMPANWNIAWVCGIKMRLTPLLVAEVHCWACRLLRATCSVTREEEQAVSTAIAGPFSPKL